MNDSETPTRNSARDRPDSFGWISIALHWTTAIVIIAMWVIGKSMSFATDGSTLSWRNVHIALGLGAWALLAGRIGWRIVCAHPRADGLSKATHNMAKTVHYVMLASLTALIASGPLLAWLGRGMPAGSAAFFIHSYAGDLLAILVITHILGALKHLMFHQDDSVIRMLWPKREK